MAVKVGDKIPEATLTYVPYDPAEKIEACPRPIPYDLHKELKGKKVVIVAVPGAFTPLCSGEHIPGFIKLADELKSKKGVDVIIGTAANDGFVMNAWGKVLGTKDKVVMASAAGSDFYEKLGLTLDLSAKGMGMRSQRFALIVNDLTVEYVGVDDSGLDNSGAEAVLKALK